MLEEEFFKGIDPRVSDQTAKKDAGKLPMQLFPSEFVDAVTKILQMGAAKYKPENWRTVEPERYEAAMLRHWSAWQKDHNSIDRESGLPNWYHFACNVLFLTAMYEAMKNGEPLPETFKRQLTRGSLWAAAYEK